MDNLIDVYYLIQLIVRQILIFLRDFVFREFTWFVPVEENLDNAGSKIRTVAPQHPAVDLLVFLAVCGLLFAFMILSANSPKSEASSYNINNIETKVLLDRIYLRNSCIQQRISMALEEDPSSFWYSRTAGLTNYLHACSDSIDTSCDIVPNMQNILHPTISNTGISQPKESRISNYKACSSHIKHSQKESPVSQTISSEWLIRRTRSGHVYGKYPI